MISNYIRVAIRNFLHQRFFSFINVVGLASGLICTLFIFLWVRDEIQKDKFHNDSEKIYHVVSNMSQINGDTITWSITPGLLADAIKEKIPGVQYAARTMNNGPQLIQFEDKNFLEKGYYADPEFFKIFSFKILKGNVNPPALDKSWIVLSETLARKIFRNEEPVGKQVRVREKLDLTVIAVVNDIHSESSIQFEYMMPMEIYREDQGKGFNWGNYNHPLYLKLVDEKNIAGISTQINDLQNALLKQGERDEVTFYVQKFSENYLHSNFVNGRPTGGRIRYVSIFSIVAIFILIIACINFMNMATAKAASRAKEVGIRKVVGAQRISLIVQFMGESIFISAISMIIAVATVALLLPLFNTLVSKAIVLNPVDPTMLFIIILIVLITGILAGSYPAFFLSSYQPGNVLKGSMSVTLSGSGLRRTLVVFQFSLTVILIASALIVYTQLEFIRTKEVGYDRNAVINIPMRGELFNTYLSFRNEILNDPGVQSVSRAGGSIVQLNNQNSSVTWPGKSPDEEPFFRTIPSDINFPETMGLTLVDGRFFSEEFNDTSNFVITQKAVEVMGLKDPVGQTISQWGVAGKIVGVVKDFHTQSLHQSIDPVIIVFKPEWTGRVFVKLKGTDPSATIARLETSFRKHNPDYPFEYTFADDDYEKIYKNEQIIGSLALGFTTMAIIISGLGLLGLAAYTAQRRKKEIGIRKTMGASVVALVAMMSKSFLNLSLIAIVIGCPIAYFLMSLFLQGYVYHIEISWMVFLHTSLGILILSTVVVSVQIIKAAVANPVDSLRSE